MLETQPGRFVLKSRESLHGRELDVVVDSQTGVNYVTYLASSSAPLSPLLDKDGKLPRVGRALMADAIGTVAGACLGTSTVTSYVESSAGVAEGGRTGLTSLTTAVMFILSLFLWPVFGAIPSFATAPALIIVGLFMMSSVLKVKFEGDMADVLGAFVAIIMMPFTYSIANGIMFGILTWMFLKIFRGKVKDIHPVMWVVFALFVLRIVTLCF